MSTYLSNSTINAPIARMELWAGQIALDPDLWGMPDLWVCVQVILLFFHPHVYFFRDSERKNAPRKISL